MCWSNPSCFNNYCNGCTPNPWNPAFCGCPQQVLDTCVFYTGPSTSCVPITSGQTLSIILQNVDKKICSIINPSGNIYVTQGVSGQITVNTTTVGNTTTNTVGLSSVITNELSTIQTNIASLQDCCANGIKGITTNTPSLLEVLNNAGTITINALNPSGNVVYDGIVSNDLTPSSTSGGGGIQTLKFYNRNYVLHNAISNGDEIKFVVIGTIIPNGSSDDLIIEIVDNNTSTVLDTYTYSGFSNITESNYMIQGVIDVGITSIGRGFVSIQPSGYLGNHLYSVFTGNSNTFNNLTINIKYNNLSTSSTGNGVQKLTVEVRKKIS